MRAQSIIIRLCDAVGAAIALALLVVPMLVIAMAIRLSDGGPALFRQQRVGRDCRPFTVLKFRTMRHDPTGAGSGVAQAGEAVEVARQRFQRTEPGDRRITKIGAVLRPSHLDELPQLLNILCGDMSFVGVRPDTPVQEGDYEPTYWRQRHTLRPGLTGPAQLRTDPLSLAERTEEELRWLRSPGFPAYLQVILDTAGKVLRRSSF